MRVCWIGIGGNLGNSRDVFDAAWEELALQSDIVLGSRSGIYHTVPVGQAAGPTFTNAVFSLSTSLQPGELLSRLQSVELTLGRKRTVRWGNRPIDLDILFIDQLIVDEQQLTIPHPAAWYRRFVIDPMVEAAPTFIHPVLKQTIAELHARLSKRPLLVADLDDSVTRWDSVSKRFPEVQIVHKAENTGAMIGFQVTGKPSAMTAGGLPIADLTTTPGDAEQRLSDFLTSVCDEPKRVGDW